MVVLTKNEKSILCIEFAEHLPKIRDIFNLSDKLGAQLNLVGNPEGATDTNYITRTLKFELVDNNSTKPCRTNPYEYGARR